LKRNITISENREVNIFYSINQNENTCVFCIDPIYDPTTLLKEDVESIYSTINDIVKINIGEDNYQKYKASFVTRNSYFWNQEWDKI
jgi:hypothetical protein